MNRDHVTLDYRRTTRECKLDDMRPDLQAAIRQHAEEKSLGDMGAQPLICIETKSERLAKRRRFGFPGSIGSSSAHYTAALVTHTWLIWAITSANDHAQAFSAYLGHVQVKDYAYKALIQDDGITITVPTPGAEKQSSVFLGLEPGPLADKFKDFLRRAIEVHAQH